MSEMETQFLWAGWTPNHHCNIFSVRQKLSEFKKKDSVINFQNLTNFQVGGKLMQKVLQFHYVSGGQATVSWV